MKEQDPDYIPRPGVPEALDPSIGNGALWESSPHFYILRSVDPLVKLDGLLVDEPTRQLIINRWNGNNEVIPEEALMPPLGHPDVIEEVIKVPEKVKSKAKQTVTRNKIKKTKPIEWEEESQELNKDSVFEPSSLPADIEEPKENKIIPPLKSIGKVGKRVRKVIKKVNKDREKDIASHQLEASPMEAQLSPFTQWLKSLRGSEYVHPYEDDYGLEQMSATARGGVSETFADLLASQGYRDKAIEMYMELMAKYPEKSSFFAAKIEGLH